MLASQVFKLVSTTLQDIEAGIASRWPWDSTSTTSLCLLDVLNASVRAIAAMRPDVTAKTEAVKLSSGMRQSIPDDAVLFLGLVRNMGQDGETDGTAIERVDKAFLLAWADMSRTGVVVENYAYDRMTDRSKYFVYPPVAANTDVYVEAMYTVEPVALTVSTQEVPLDGRYEQALFHHMLASILGGDNESSNATQAAYHLQAFSQAMTSKGEVDSSWPTA
ncbi:MAG: DUF6682 family protein [Pseudomonadota bacterium]